MEHLDGRIISSVHDLIVNFLTDQCQTTPTVLHHDSDGNTHALGFCMRTVPSKCLTDSSVLPTDLANRSRVVSSQMAKPCFQTNSGLRTTHTTLNSPRYEAKEWAEHPEFSVPSEPRMKWTIMHRSPTGYITPSLCNLDRLLRRLLVEYPKPTSYFGLYSRTVFSP